MVKAIFGGHFELHLWFVYVLMGLYLVLPILRVLVSAAPRILNYFLLLWLVANPLWNLFGRISGETVEPALRLSTVEGYAGYMILGYVLRQWTPSRRGMWVMVLVFFTTGFAVFAGSSVLSAHAGYFDSFLYDYLGFPVIVMSASFLLWFKALENVLHEKRMPILKGLADAAYGIYLVHIFVIAGLRFGWFGFELYSWMGPPVYMIPLTGLAVFAISFVFTFVMQKLPVLKYLV
jgi:surface polysaccharide O-acyltransferase-like enzyme